MRYACMWCEPTLFLLSSCLWVWVGILWGVYLQRSAPFANFCFSVESCYAGETRSTWTFWMFVRMTPNTNNTDDAISERIWNFTRAMTPSIDSDNFFLTFDTIHIIHDNNASTSQPNGTLNDEWFCIFICISHSPFVNVGIHARARTRTWSHHKRDGRTLREIIKRK